MSAYITDNTCEDVTICDPNVIVQECLPVGEDQHCLYTIDLSVPLCEGWYYNNLDMTGYSGWGWYWTPTYAPIEFALNKMVGDPAVAPHEYWLAEADGGDYNDFISGIGLLHYLNDSTGGSGAVAQVEPSVYLGDLIYFNLSGGAGDDFVEGANNADILDGGTGNDCVVGQGGDDSLTGGDGDDKLYGGDGKDLIDGGKGNDYVEAGKGSDGITGGDGNDIIFAGSGDDNLDGGAGDDQLWGEDGNDWSAGGAGNDTIISANGDDCADGGSGDDYMDMGDGNDRALGGLGNDTMLGGAGNDKLDGQAGDDVVDGQDGNDLVDGGDGDDVVYGGNGNDIVRGGLGEDVVYGGAGCDIFAFCEVEFNCSDEIGDFSAGRDPDQIDLSNLDDLDSIRIEETGFNDMVRIDLIVDGEAVQQILVNSADDANLQSVFSKDTAYGTDQGALVKVGAGVMVDLPSTSVIFSDGDGLFY